MIISTYRHVFEAASQNSQLLTFGAMVLVAVILIWLEKSALRASLWLVIALAGLGGLIGETGSRLIWAYYLIVYASGTTLLVLAGIVPATRRWTWRVTDCPAELVWSLVLAGVLATGLAVCADATTWPEPKKPFTAAAESQPASAPTAEAPAKPTDRKAVPIKETAQEPTAAQATTKTASSARRRMPDTPEERLGKQMLIDMRGALALSAVVVLTALLGAAHLVRPVKSIPTGRLSAMPTEPAKE